MVRTQLYDIDIAANEITQFTKDPWYGHEVLEMRPLDVAFGGDGNFANALRDGQARRSAQIAQECELLKSVLSVSSNISQTITNLRIQWSIIGLTLVSIGIAIAALYVSVRTMPK